MSTDDGKKRTSSTAARSSALGTDSAGGARRRSVGIQLGLAAVLVGLIGAIAFGVTRDKSTNDAAPVQPPAVARADGAIRIGSADPKVVVTVVEDFQCPACKQFEAAGSATLTELATGDVAVDYRPIAILNRMSSTNYSTRAAAAAYCVAEADIGAWPAWHAAMFAQQPAEGGAGLTDRQIIDIAAAAGITGDPVAQCITSNRYGSYADQNTTAATDGGIDHTPTVLVDGKEVQSPTPEALRAAVAAAQ